MFEHLQFHTWPFQVVPDEKSAQIWADREEVRRDLRLLLRSYQRSAASSINLLWAYFGAGKTHFLRHLEWLAGESAPRLMTCYSVFPKTVKSFVDIYRMLAKSWSVDLLVDSYTRLEALGDDQLVGTIDPELLLACRTLAVRPEVAPVVVDWLRAGRPTLRQLNEIGLSQRIESAERAIEICVAGIRLITAGQQVPRLVWLVDEFQRIGSLKAGQRADINIGLHSVFNELPRHFSLLLSFSFGDPQNIRYLLSEELLDRAQMQRYFQLPPLTRESAAVFIRDIIVSHRFQDSSVDPLFPFDSEAIQSLVAAIDEHRGLDLKPRTLMQVFNAVLEEADLAIEELAMSTISPEFALSIFQERVSDLVSDHQEDDE